MIAIVSERRFKQQLIRLDGLDPDTTPNEMSELALHYAPRLLNFVADNHGVRRLGHDPGQGELGYFHFEQAPGYGPSGRAGRIQGLAYLARLSASVEREDLRGLPEKGLLLAAIEDAWPTIAAQFQRIPLGELEKRLEEAGMSVAFGPRRGNPADAQSPASVRATVNESDFQLFLKQAGLKDMPDRRTAHEQ